jgi:FKBP-type peptidyl-prolyl cis-trans isomerase FkpA/FKBP-type peptidyl-prolyl cis-trans isomerase FklB
MKKTIFMLFAAAALMSSCNSTNQSSNVALENTIDSVSYAIGANLGSNILRQIESAGDTNLSYAAMVKGFTQGLNSELLEIDETEGTVIINSYMKEKDAERREAEKAAFSANIEVGEAFLAENAQREGVIVTESGLQYEIVEEGTGESPIDGDRVKVNYEGTLIDGQVFDSSYERGEPISFDINRVIPGWTEGLKLMPSGSTFMLYIPSNLGYGENPPPNSIIEPFSTLVFKVELLEIEK